MGHPRCFFLQEDRQDGLIMLYRNIRTGRMIDIPSKLTDVEWELVEEQAPADSVVSGSKKTAAEKAKKRTGKKRNV